MGSKLYVGGLPFSATKHFTMLFATHSTVDPRA